MAISTCNPNAFLSIIIILVILSAQQNYVDGGSHTASTKMVKGTIKTIQTEGGDVIDCVDIYKQPALNHPLLKNHKIQLEPSSPARNKTKMNINSQREVVATWANKNGGCPNGTVPIHRNPIHVDILRDLSKARRSRSQSYSNQRGVHEYALVQERHGNKDIRGGQGRFNVWNPRVAEGSNEFSVAQIWLLSGEGDTQNTIEAGWMVYPLKYGHSRTVFFTYWTNDGYRSGGMCYNLDCEGFVQTSRNFAPGDAIPHISVPNGNQVEIDIMIYKDKDKSGEGNWWLEYDGTGLGYWPATLFPAGGLGSGANKILWGGEVVDIRSQKQHTSTQMGSGEFPSAGFGLASYVNNLKYKKAGNNWVEPERLSSYITNDNCYDAAYRFPPPGGSDSRGVHMLFGGPGFNPRCQ